MGMLDKVKLHIGCAEKNFGQDWIHIDIDQYPHIKYHDVENLPFHDNSIDLIYSCHMITYYDRYEVVKVLKEWLRVLKPGGILRLAVPDFDMIAVLYVMGTIDITKVIGPVCGRWPIRDKYIYHKAIYDEKLLTQILKQSGFIKIRKWNWRKTEHSQFDDYSQAYIPHMDKENGTLISLNIEAIK